MEIKLNPCKSCGEQPNLIRYCEYLCAVECENCNRDVHGPFAEEVVSRWNQMNPKEEPTNDPVPP